MYGEKRTGKKYGGGKYGKKSKAGQEPFRSRDFVTSGEKSPTRADIAQRPVAHAQNIFPNMASSGHVTSGSSSSLLANATWTVPIYY